jgi:uncharacterized membrane protein required for colicin V production
LQYAIDIIIVAIVVLVGINGYRRGFLVSATSMGGKIAAILIAILCRKPFSQFLDSIFNLRDKFTPYVTSIVDRTISNELPVDITALESMPVLGSIPFTEIKDDYVNQYSFNIVTWILEIISVLALLLIIYLTIAIMIKFFIKPLSKKRGLSLLDKGAGLVVSCLCIIFLLSIFCRLSQPLLSVSPKFEESAGASIIYPQLINTSDLYISPLKQLTGNLFEDPRETPLKFAPSIEIENYLPPGIRLSPNGEQIPDLNSPTFENRLEI